MNVFVCLILGEYMYFDVVGVGKIFKGVFVMFDLDFCV